MNLARTCPKWTQETMIFGSKNNQNQWPPANFNKFKHIEPIQHRTAYHLPLFWEHQKHRNALSQSIVPNPHDFLPWIPPFQSPPDFPSHRLPSSHRGSARCKVPGVPADAAPGPASPRWSCGATGPRGQEDIHGFPKMIYVSGGFLLVPIFHSHQNVSRNGPMFNLLSLPDCK